MKVRIRAELTSALDTPLSLDLSWLELLVDRM